ncbi:hypothetical protein [Ornithinimicrobium faecis]|uniref:hypothetical protein n=1 Tax=Ornithinimicrobium faecis TaxID=2934158 RepID=UPI0021185EB7|nr:hypothetical protein [Ornithinimicrobium sp. HY1745]
MIAVPATSADLDWIVSVLARRREPLVEYAPIFWRAAPDAGASHRAFIESLLTEGGARAFRTSASVLIAAPRGDGWLVDDAFVEGKHWACGDGRDLWAAFAADCHGSRVRFVCPTYEHDRADYARAVGLAVAESWWLLELPNSGGGEPGVNVPLPGADAVTVGAPPVYAPPGPVLFLPAPDDVDAALSVAVAKAPELGCAAIVVNQRAGDHDLANSLTSYGFRRHCDYYTGLVRSI